MNQAPASTSTTPPPAPRGATAWHRTPVLVAALLVAGAALVAASWWMTGPAPKDADAGMPDPPPLVLPSGVEPSSPLGTAAGRLAAGEHEAARSGFVDVVADDPENVAGQVGLVLSGWRTVGPDAVIADLAQLAREHPEDPLPAFHLGVSRLLRGDRTGADEALEETVMLGRSAGDATGIRLARLADDLLHPGAFRAYVPLLVSPSDVPPAERAALRRVLAAIQRDDRRGAVAAAATFRDSTSPHAATILAVTEFDKDDTAATAERLERIARDAASPTGRDRALIHAGLARVWGGGDRSEGCGLLRRAASPQADPGTRRLARPIFDEICN